MTEDSINLLKECDSGCKMAISSIDQIQDFVADSRLKGLIADYKDEHVSLKRRAEQMLGSVGEDGENPGMMASAFAWMSTEMKLSMNSKNTEIAKVLMDGCNMGIQSLGEKLNQYTNASSDAIDLTKELIRCEEEFGKKMENYL